MARRFKLPKWLKSGFRDWSPDLIVWGPDGEAYLLRWYVIPRNPVFNVYVHCLLQDDAGRHLHDHRAHNLSIIFRGSYMEFQPASKLAPSPYVLAASLPQTVRLRSAGHIVARKATSPHRLEVGNGPVWSLFVKLWDYRDWGFHTPAGWIQWEDYITNPEHNDA